MVDNINRRRVVRGHGAKGRWHEAKFETLEDPTVIIDARWQNLS
jgi:hypothetical protein